MRQVLSKKKMETLTTRRLLAYRNTLLRCREEGHWDGDGDDSCICKDSPQWQEAYAECIALLSAREHVAKRQKNKRRTP